MVTILYTGSQCNQTFAGMNVDITVETSTTLMTVKQYHTVVENAEA